MAWWELLHTSQDSNVWVWSNGRMVISSWGAKKSGEKLLQGFIVYY